MSYFNTTGETGNQLKLFRKKAESQENQIYEFLKEHEFHWYTAEALRLLVAHPNTPITSVRRALTNLLNKRKIQRSEKANAMGEYGRYVHTYRFNPYMED